MRVAVTSGRLAGPLADGLAEAGHDVVRLVEREAVAKMVEDELRARREAIELRTGSGAPIEPAPQGTPDGSEG